MLVVPISKDIITTKDGVKYRVVEYTNYKEGGPAVYCRLPKNSELFLIYFFDIDTINGTRVEFNRSQRVFNALGRIHRDQHLPQPGDMVEVPQATRDGDEPATNPRVASLKLKSKSLGINKGMFVKDGEGNYHRIRHLTNITRELGGTRFNRKEFLEYYRDYIGV
jgi:hypothetical protein